MIDENLINGGEDEIPGNDDIFDPSTEPTPEPEPFPEPGPELGPEPEPFHDPGPEPTSEPFPDPYDDRRYRPEPDTDFEDPDADIEELLRRTKHLAHNKPDKPSSVERKMCPTRHGCQGATDCDYCMGNYPV